MQSDANEMAAIRTLLYSNDLDAARAMYDSKDTDIRETVADLYPTTHALLRLDA